jgi:hypothetical protein
VRVWDEDRGGFGTCRHCGAAMKRCRPIAEERRFEKAKRDLEEASGS